MKYVVYQIEEKHVFISPMMWRYTIQVGQKKDKEFFSKAIFPVIFLALDYIVDSVS